MLHVWILHCGGAIAALLIGPPNKSSLDANKSSPATLEQPESNELFEELMGGDTLPPKGKPSDSPRSSAEHDVTNQKPSQAGKTADTAHSRLGDLFVSGPSTARNNSSSSSSGSSNLGLQLSTPSAASPPDTTQRDSDAANKSNPQRRAGNRAAKSPLGSAGVMRVSSSPKSGAPASSMSHQQRASARSWAPKPEEKASLAQSPLQGGPTGRLGVPPQRTASGPDQIRRQEISLRFPRGPYNQEADQQQAAASQPDSAARLARLRQKTTLDAVSSQRSEAAVRVMQSQHTKEVLENLPELVLAKGWEQQGQFCTTFMDMDWPFAMPVS